MAEEGTIAIRQDVLDKMGNNVSTTYAAEDYTNRYIKQAEGYLCMATRFDWVTKYNNLGNVQKEALKEIVSNLAAIYIINVDMSERPRGEFELRAMILWRRAMDGIKELRDRNILKFMGAE